MITAIGPPCRHLYGTVPDGLSGATELVRKHWDQEPICLVTSSEPYPQNDVASETFQSTELIRKGAIKDN